MLSHLDFRLSCYLMAIFNFDYYLISKLNTFNNISKNRYLSYTDKPTKHVGVFKGVINKRYSLKYR